MGKNEIVIVFFGENNFSSVVLNALINEGYNIPLVVCPFYENAKHKGLENTANQLKAEFIRAKNINSPEIVQKVAEMKPDLCVCGDFSKIIGKDILAIPKLGAINLHPSLLPKYRGLAPQHFPIINGENATGVTVHYIDENIDTGNIIIQKEIPIRNDMYVSELLVKWHEIYQTIVNEAVSLVFNGDKGRIQDAEGSFYGRLKEKDCEIFFEKGVSPAYNLVRGVSSPYFGAFLKIKSEQGNVLRVWEAEIERTGEQKEFGKIEIENEDMLIYFPDGILRGTYCEWENSNNK
jgi:methionyl-tRNA formyltransferase